MRFLKDTIESWPIDRFTGMPQGVAGGMHSPYLLDQGTHLGVYQALSTRSGGEVISAFD